MGHILRVKNKQGEWVNIPAIKGEKGDTGNSGVYVGSGEMPADCNVQIDPDGEVTTEDCFGEWIEIADITTTEEVNSFYFTTDKDGNTFNCKRIVAKLRYPQSISKTYALYVGCGGDNMYSAPYTAMNLGTTIWGADVYVELVKGKGVIFEIHMIGEKDVFIANLLKGKIIRLSDKESLSAFRVAISNSSDFVPIGSSLKIWGLKQ